MARGSSFIPRGGIHALKAPVGLKATGAFSFEITGSSAGHGGGSARLIYSHESNPMNQFWSKIDMTNETGIAPAILRLYPGLDAGQRELIRRLEGPVLGIAGPGAGKTLSVALRAANILLLGTGPNRRSCCCAPTTPTRPVSCVSGWTQWAGRRDTTATSGARASAPSTACAVGSWPNTPSGWV